MSNPKQADPLQQKIDELAAENEHLKRQLTAQKGQTTRARSALAETRARIEGEKPRATKAAKDPLSTAELQELLADAEQLELVAHDGRAELLGIDPLVVRARDFQRHVNGLVLRGVKWIVQGPGPKDQPYPVNGYALFVDGELAAVSQRDRQMNVGSGMHVNLAEDVIFHG